MKIPNKREFYRGCKEYERHEKRNAMYKVATFLVAHFWGKPSEMADGLGVLLLTWNQAFYRYGLLCFDKLEKCIADNLKMIENFRNRDIFSLSDKDSKEIQELFSKFLEALQIKLDKGESKKSPVAVAKALHLLAPKFFPLWDAKIAQAYGCDYSRNPQDKYILFCRLTKTIAVKVKNYLNQTNKTVIKLIDEYNYAKCTQGWI